MYTEIIDQRYLQTKFLVYCKIEILSVFRYTKDDLYVNAELHRHASSRELLRYLLCSRKIHSCLMKREMVQLLGFACTFNMLQRKYIIILWMISN